MPGGHGLPGRALPAPRARPGHGQGRGCRGMGVSWDGSCRRVFNDLWRIRLFPHPLSRQQVFSLSQSSCVSPVGLIDLR